MADSDNKPRIFHILMHASGKHIHKVSRLLNQSKSLLRIVSLVVLLTACQPSQVTPPALPFFPTYTLSPLISATATESTTPNTVSALITQVSPSPVVSPTSIATIAPDPMQLVSPTQAQDHVSDWRPPLYPTPWAPTLYDHFYFASPIAANEVNIPVQDYRYGGVFFQDVVHTGVDIPAPKRTPILAAGPGTVVWAGFGVYQGGFDPADPYGLAVSIQHDFGYQNQILYTIYGHMDEINVVEGQHVETGDILGLVGETGTVTGPHLHFEVRIGENSFFATRNPELWLVPPIGWGIIAGRVMDTNGQLINDQQIIITDPKSEQNLFAWSYGKTSVNSDKYYQENMVVGDLPAGNYVLRAAFAGVNFSAPIEVSPGMVNYYTFRGYYGFTIESPPAPGANFTPSPLETPIP
jgi:murein DD-endopeptidase MepM/ murein hydrolase activator NlpD